MRRLPRAPSGFVTRACRVILPASQRSGGMAEWLKAHAWKACIRETVSWVRIPLPPPTHPCVQKSSFCWRSRRLTPESAGEGSHSVLNECAGEKTPLVEPRIATSRLAALHGRIGVRHELGPTVGSETQAYAKIRNMYAS